MKTVLAMMIVFIMVVPALIFIPIAEEGFGDDETLVITPGESFAPGRDWKLYTLAGAFDPLIDPTPALPNLRLTSPTGYYVIQCNRMRDGTEKDVLMSMGVTIFSAFNNMGWLVAMNPQVKTQVQQLDFIRWVGNYEPAYKVRPSILNNPGVVRATVEFFEPNLIRGYGWGTELGDQTLEFPRPEKEVARNAIESIGGVIDEAWSDYDLASFLVFEMDASQIPLLAFAKEVKTITEAGTPELSLNQVRVYSNVDNVQTALGNQGGLWTNVVREGDAGSASPRLSHQEFGSGYGNSSQVVGATGSYEWHITHTTAIWTSIGADPNYRGIVPSGRIHTMSWADSDASVASYLDGSGGYMVSDSWGYGGADANGEYSGTAYQRDLQSWNRGEAAAGGESILFVSSAGNYGGTGTGVEGIGNSVAATSTSKNGLCAGGMADHASTVRTNHDWCDYIEMDQPSGGAQTGFTDDQRHKPDLWAAADMLNGAARSADYASDTSYGNFGGTSAAAPTIASTASLAQHAYIAGLVNTENDPTPGSVHMSTVKAMLYSSTYQNQLGVKSTRRSMGYGEPDIGFASDSNMPMVVLSDSNKYAQGGSQSISTEDTFVVEPIPGYDLRISLVWTDSPGPTGSGPTLINDLDMEVTSDGSGTYWLGNRGLFDMGSFPWGDEYSNSYFGGVKSNPATASPGNADHANNDESVFITNPSGSYTIKVKGYDTPDGSMPYSLVAYGVQPLKLSLSADNVFWSSGVVNPENTLWESDDIRATINSTHQSGVFVNNSAWAFGVGNIIEVGMAVEWQATGFVDDYIYISCWDTSEGAMLPTSHTDSNNYPSDHTYFLDLTPHMSALTWAEIADLRPGAYYLMPGGTGDDNANLQVDSIWFRVMVESGNNGRSEVFNVQVDPTPTEGAPNINLTADITDLTGGGNRLIAAEYFIDTIGNSGTGGIMFPTDGTFDFYDESVNGSVSMDGLNDGEHTIYVHGRDGAGIWGNFSSAIVNKTSFYQQAFVSGWYSISLPVTPNDNSSSSVLASVEGQYDIVQWFDQNDKLWKHWSIYDSQNNNTLTEISPSMGIYIHFNFPTVLDILGSACFDYNTTLLPGWNLVGYPTETTDIEVGTAFQGIAYERVERHNITDGTSKIMASNNILVPGQLYWVYVPLWYSGPQEWRVNW